MRVDARCCAARLPNCAVMLLQVLIGGEGGAGLDLEDLRAHVNYAGGYHEEHPVIQELWRVRGG